MNGKHYELELHIIHQYKGTDGMLGGGIAIFFDSVRYGKHYQTESEFFDSIFNIIDEGTGTVQIKALFQGVDFTNYWNYRGSSTTPPC